MYIKETWFTNLIVTVEQKQVFEFPGMLCSLKVWIHLVCEHIINFYFKETTEQRQSNWVKMRETQDRKNTPDMDKNSTVIWLLAFFYYVVEFDYIIWISGLKVMSFDNNWLPNKKLDMDLWSH